ncbi:MAG: hypothetical protein FWG50_05330, partial [Kiritimatiellaeota bacterium]|nr:hypothetical protein [Kiritimatiellota bacterium]
PRGERPAPSPASRPLPPLSRARPGEPYSEVNALWPLAHFSLNGNGSHVLPVFWGKDYFHVAPLYWHIDRKLDSLFPLWIYQPHTYGYNLDILWPLFNRYHHGDSDHGLRVFPLFSHTRNGDRSSSAWWLAGLGGAETRADGTAAHWLLPFYAYDSADASFYSLAYARSGDTTAIPPLLSLWRKDPATGATDFYSLAGLFHQRYNAPPGQRAGRLLPLYAYDDEDNAFYSLLYTRHRDTTLIPPLLSWRSVNPRTHTRDLYALGGLFHNRSGGPDGEDRSWLLPLYYSDSRNFISPLWAHGTGKDGQPAWRIVPPLISWWDTDPATGAKDFYTLGGLFRQRYNVPDAQRAGHLFPLYAYDNAHDAFYSLLYTRHRNTTVIPPLLSWQGTDPDTGAKDFNALGGLFRLRHGNPDGKGAGHLFPLYSYDRAHDYLLTPLYIRDKGTTAIPPLLSWQSADPATGAKDFYTLGGLFHQRHNADNRKGYLFPLYAYDTSDRSFYTLLYGQWSVQRGDGTVRQHRYYLTPLVRSVHSPSYHESCFFPLFSHETRGAQRFHGDPLGFAREHQHNAYYQHYTHTRILILAKASRDYSFDCKRESQWMKLLKDDTLPHDSAHPAYSEKSSAYIFPLWNASSRKETIFEDDLSAVRHDGLLEKNALLFFLYDYKREFSQSESHSYTRRRILWRLMHYEKLNGDTSLDIFPAITWDAKADGSRKTSFLWRFFRYERPAEGRAKLDLLFIPVLR